MKVDDACFAGLTLANRPIEYWVNYVTDREDKQPVIIVTPNVDHFNRLALDSSFGELYSDADYVLCDSRIVQKLSLLFEDKPVKHVVPGSDLTAIIFSRLDNSDCNVFVVGPTDSEVNKVRVKYSLTALQSFNPSMGFIRNENEVESIVSAIISAKPKIVFLAVGSPQQEALAVKIKKRYSDLGLHQGPVLLCVGASIDFIIGKVTRAPVFMQKAHLEWLFRALTEPRRLIPRYYNNFCWLVSYAWSRVLHRVFSRTKYN